MSTANPLTEFLDSDLEKIPDLITYSANLELLRNTDFSHASLFEIKQAYDKYATIIPSIFTIRTPEQFNQLYFYRVRMNIVNEDLDLIQTYSYPSPAFCKTNGRANLKGRTVFYCSNNPYAAIIESKPQIGQTGYLSIWKATTNRNIKLALLLPATLRTDNIWNELAKGAFEYAISHSNANAKDKAQQYILLHEFLAKLFVSESFPYPITSMLADQLLYTNDTWKDAILYPSVGSDSLYCNFAFHPNVVDQFLQLEKVIPFVVKELHPNFRYTAGQVGSLKHTAIYWNKNVKMEDIDFRNLHFD